MLSGDNGILQKATEAKTLSERAEAKEQARIDIMAWITDKTANHENSSLDDSKVQTILTGKSYVKTANSTSFITAKGEYEIPYSELYTASDTTSVATLPAGTYSTGEEITFGGEQFFVVADDGDRVRLLAKFCLNQEGTYQTDKDATTSEYGRPFSQTSYWSDNNHNVISSDPFDLQTPEMIEEAREDGTIIQNAILTAIAYGESKKVSGRLMNCDEVTSMISSNSEIMYGKWTDGTQPTEGFLFWWYGVDFGGSPGCVSGNFGPTGGRGSANPIVTDIGVRPVLVVPES